MAKENGDGKMVLEGLVNIEAWLLHASHRIDPNTIQHASEISREWPSFNKDSDLRQKWFYTADSALYMIEEGEPVLYFGGRDTNLVFKNIEESTRIMMTNREYIPNKEDIQMVVNSVQTGKTLKVKLSDLEIKGDNQFTQDFEVTAADYSRLTGIKRELVERIYGPENDFMEMLAGSGRTKAVVSVQNPEYVKQIVPEGAAVAGTCILFSPCEDFNFWIEGNSVTQHNCCLRGVPTISEGDVEIVKQFYELLKDPVASKVAVDMLTPDAVVTLSNVMAIYLKDMVKYLP